MIVSPRPAVPSTLMPLPSRSTSAGPQSFWHCTAPKFLLVSGSEGILVRLLEGSTVGDSLRIENHYVCKHAFLDKSAVIEPEVCSGQSRKPVHGFRKGNDFFFADVFAEQAGEVAIGAWMRGRFEEHALRGHRRCI